MFYKALSWQLQKQKAVESHGASPSFAKQCPVKGAHEDKTEEMNELLRESLLKN